MLAKEPGIPSDDTFRRVFERDYCHSRPVAQLGDLYQQEQWAGLKTIVIVERTRRLWKETTHEVQFYLSSLQPDAGKIGRAIRQHWGIENQLHWTLDVTFGEDRSRVRRGHGPENLGLLRRLALIAVFIWIAQNFCLEKLYRGNYFVHAIENRYENSQEVTLTLLNFCQVHFIHFKMSLPC